MHISMSSTFKRLGRGLGRQWAGFLALFLVLTTGTAYAAATITSSDIVDGEVKRPDIARAAVTGWRVADESLTSPDVRDGSLTGSDVANDTITGADIFESGLGAVPTANWATVAAQGGTGRMGTVSTCTPPTGGTFTECAGTWLHLRSAGRVLVLASARVGSLDGRTDTECRVEADGTPIPSARYMYEAYLPQDSTTVMPVNGVTGILPAGDHWLGVACAKYAGPDSVSAQVSAVALSNE